MKIYIGKMCLKSVHFDNLPILMTGFEKVRTPAEQCYSEATSVC